MGEAVPNAFGRCHQEWVISRVFYQIFTRSKCITGWRKYSGTQICWHLNESCVEYIKSPPVWPYGANIIFKSTKSVSPSTFVTLYFPSSLPPQSNTWRRVQTSVGAVITTAFVWCGFNSPLTVINDHFKLAASHNPNPFLSMTVKFIDDGHGVLMFKGRHP